MMFDAISQLDGFERRQHRRRVRLRRVQRQHERRVVVREQVHQSAGRSSLHGSMHHQRPHEGSARSDTEDGSHAGAGSNLVLVSNVFCRRRHLIVWLFSIVIIILLFWLNGALHKVHSSWYNAKRYELVLYC